jgi:hypothetical protein
VRRFKLSNDPQFAAKLREIVGLYVNPPDPFSRSMRKAKSRRWMMISGVRFLTQGFKFIYYKNWKVIER